MRGSILLTGATGALGSLILPRLVAYGYRVICLVREAAQQSPADRLIQTVGRLHEVSAIRGDLREPLCGVSNFDLELLRSCEPRIVHCAASIDFTDEARAYSTNVDGVNNLLELATSSHVSDIAHVSTAYVAGSASRFTESDLDVGQAWRNAYERTKYHGERLVREWGALRGNRRYTIFRPSILIGCEDGSSPAFDAYYGYFRPLHDLAAAMRAKVRASGVSQGLEVLPDGCVALPIVLTASPHSTLNMVPLDWAADMLVAVLAHGSSNETIHLVHPRPPMVRSVISISLEILNILSIRLAGTLEERELLLQHHSPLTTRLQRQIDAIHGRYIPYVTHEAKFSMEALPRVLGTTRYRLPPPIDAILLRRLLSYAIAANWGLPERRSVQLERGSSQQGPANRSTDQTTADYKLTRLNADLPAPRKIADLLDEFGGMVYLDYVKTHSARTRDQ
jgi:nucleoside-diphosphate-sugar epimerase